MTVPTAHQPIKHHVALFACQGARTPIQHHGTINSNNFGRRKACLLHPAEMEIEEGGATKCQWKGRDSGLDTEEGGGVSGRGEGNSDAGVREIGDALAIKLWRQI